MVVWLHQKKKHKKKQTRSLNVLNVVHLQVKPLRANLITAFAVIYYWTDSGRVGGARGRWGGALGDWRWAETVAAVLIFQGNVKSVRHANELNYWGGRVCSRADPSPACTWGVSNKIPRTVAHTPCPLASTILWLLSCWKLLLLLAVWGAANLVFLN